MWGKSVTKKLMQTCHKLRTNRDGHFAVWFSLVAVPLVIGASIVVDLQNATANKASIKNALDTAVLAAVSNRQLSSEQTEAFAEQVFLENYTGAAKLDLEVFPSTDRVQMTATGAVSSTMGKLSGKGDMNVSVSSTAVMDKNNTICVLALATDLAESVRFIEGTQFSAKNCSVQSNSSHNTAILSNSLTTPSAKAFCAVGGASGPFDPYIRSQCSAITDPFVNRKPPAPGPCKPGSMFNPVHVDDLGERPPGSHNHKHSHGADGSHTHAHLADQTHHHVRVPMPRLTELGASPRTFNRLLDDYDDKLLSVEESQNYTGHSLTLNPGTYCGGLTIDGQNVVFRPGVYTMLDGPLTFKNRATARAEGVSFVMNGQNSVLTVETGSYVYVKAPNRGEMRGLAFYQVRNPFSTTYPNGINLIHSGGSLNVVGTLYFPTQAVDVFGDSELGASAPATSFIAHQVTFSDDVEANIRVDAAMAGLPPMEPTSDDGARLIE